MRSLLTLLGVLIISPLGPHLAVHSVSSALAQEAPTPTLEATPAEPAPTAPVDDFERGTPRSAMREFLAACNKGDYERAQNYLDLRRLRPGNRPVQGPQLARQLCIVIERTVWIDPELLSDSPEGDRDDGLPPRRDSAAVLKSDDKPVRLLLERVRREDGIPIWKISAETVDRIPDLYREFGYGPLEVYLPRPFFEIRFLGVQLWQWIGLIVALTLAWGISWIGTQVVVWVGARLLTRFWNLIQEDLLNGTRRPLRWFLAVQLFSFSLEGLRLSLRATAITRSLLAAASWILTAWFLLRIIDAGARLIEARAANRQAVAALLPLGKRATKILAVTLTALAALQNLGFNVTSLLAGLGLGGLAVALAGQRTLEHLFGGITLVADQPVRVGEFCRFGDKLGTVVDIGLRSTWIRTPDRTLLSIPNGQFASMQIENFSRRDRMHFTTTLNLHSDSSVEQLRQVLDGIRQTLATHPKVFPESSRATLAGFGNRSFDIEVSAYVRTTDFREFANLREELLFRFLQVLAENRVRLAFG